VATTRVRVDAAGALKALGEITARAENPARYMRVVSTQMHRDIIEHFDRESGPSGSWKAWSPKYAAWRAKHKPGKILHFSGAGLRETLRISSGKNYASVGSALDYAPTHDSGDPTRNIPKRVNGIRPPYHT
jgi:phage gpG-like protein